MWEYVDHGKYREYREQGIWWICRPWKICEDRFFQAADTKLVVSLHSTDLNKFLKNFLQDLLVHEQLLDLVANVCY